MDIKQYRSLVTTVFQDFAKYNLTLGENVQVSDLNNQNVHDIDQALTESSFYPNKNAITLDQMLGKMFSNSTDLSGGEWQKIAVARAFFANKEFLILDEPTASIDAKIEHQLFKNFIELSKNKTVIFVTHRLSSVKRADKVLLLKKGKVVGYSSHDDLIKHNAYYRELYQLQAAPYTEEISVEKNSMLNDV